MTANRQRVCLVILGAGYSGARVADVARERGWHVTPVRRQAVAGAVAFDDPGLADILLSATHILSSVPTDPESGADPVLFRFGSLLQQAGASLFYLSSTGVYGDTGGAWVDESAPILGEGGAGRRSARAAADRAWQDHGATILRLPGIYGPGRSALDQVRAGRARRIDRPGHRFNRIHVEDIAGAAIALMSAGARGVFNIVDFQPAEPRDVIEHACRLLGAPLPPLEPLETADLSPMARGFWSERRLVAGRKLGRVTGYRLRYPDYKSGLEAILAAEGGQ